MPGVKLTNAAQDPFYNSGSIRSTGGYGVQATSIGVFWHITNAAGGLISATGADSEGVVLAQGSVTNAGTISGSKFGVYFYGLPSTYSDHRGTVTNSGTITGSTFGVSILPGGVVVNNRVPGPTAGVISGNTGVYLRSGLVQNYSFIFGAMSGGVGAGISSGTDCLIYNGPAGLVTPEISGSTGIKAGGTSGIYNYGLIQGTSGRGIDLGAGRVNNSGSIVGTSSGVVIGGANAYLNNHGFIDVASPGFEGTNRGFGVSITSGFIRNSGTISGPYAVRAEYGNVVNTGLIQGEYFGVLLHSGGAVTNFGTITSNGFGVNAYRATVLNAGTIIGGTYAVELLGVGSRVIVEPTAKFIGDVTGDGGVLELRGNGGTLTGFGSQFRYFEMLAIDGSTTWTLPGASSADNLTIDASTRSTLKVSGTATFGGTLTLGHTVTNTGGTLAVVGHGSLRTDALVLRNDGSVNDVLSVAPTGTVQVGSGTGALAGRINVMANGSIAGAGVLRGSVVDKGHIEASGKLTVTGNVVGTGTITIDANSVLTVNGNLQNKHVVFASGASEVLRLPKPLGETGTISGFNAAGHGIDLLKTLAVTESFAGGLLTLKSTGGATVGRLHFAGAYISANFALATDHNGGTLVTFKP